MVTIKNERLEVAISERGAELKSVKSEGREMLWCADPKYWNGTAPILFPICGGLKDDKYTLEGREYFLEKHGFAMNSDFAIESVNDTSATFLLTDNEETLKQYPWHFELRVIYTLIENALKVTFDIKNNSEDTMYFSIGSHEAYACPEGIEAYDIIFPQKENLDSWQVDGNLLAHRTIPVLRDSNVLPILRRYFEVDGLIFKDLKSRSATLRNRNSGQEIRVEFPDFDYLLIWTVPSADYLCIEPWCGIPSMVDDGYAIEEKEAIIKLASNSSTQREHTIYF